MVVRHGDCHDTLSAVGVKGAPSPPFFIVNILLDADRGDRPIEDEASPENNDENI